MEEGKVASYGQKKATIGEQGEDVTEQIPPEANVTGPLLLPRSGLLEKIEFMYEYSGGNLLQADVLSEIKIASVFVLLH